MKKYSFDMSNEQAPSSGFPAGKNKCIITKCEESTSKAGNVMFILTLTLESDPAVTMTVYAVATPKKRWLLKQLLSVCDVKAAANGVYDFEVSDVLNKTITACVKIEPENWIDRDGNPRTTNKSRVYGFEPAIPF